MCCEARDHKLAKPSKENCGIKSRKTECPFRLKFSYNKQEEVYKLLPGSILDHNHPPDDVACFWQYRRLTPTMYACAIDMISQMSPGSILNALQSKFGLDCLVTYDDIRNLQQRIWREERGGMRATEAMLSVLKSVNMSSRCWLHPSTAELLGVIITDPMAIVMAQTYGHVLQMDCTYKTNKYNMPMFHVTSHTAMDHTFTETIADYTRALQELPSFIPTLPTKVVVTDSEAALAAALKSVCSDWTQLLCRWHVGQNILTEFKKTMNIEQWNVVMTHWRGILGAKTERL